MARNSHRGNADAFDPAVDDARSSTKVEVKKCFEALSKFGHDDAAEMIRHPDQVDKEELGISGTGDPDQLRIARELARKHLSGEQIDAAGLRAGRLKW